MHFSILELVDAAIPADQIDPVKQTILQVEGVKVIRSSPLSVNLKDDMKDHILTFGCPVLGGGELKCY